MNINRVGKFEALKIVNEFDKELIEMYGINMTDAKISRYEALSAVEENQGARKAAEALGMKLGLTMIRQAA